MLRSSIIIPIYNHPGLTQQCLNALLAAKTQSVDFEVIAVDDASTGVTQKLLAGYGDNVRVLTHTTNTGFAAACNDGGSVAAGEYLIFLNNDTIPTVGWLDALVRYADSHPNAAAVGSKLLYPNNTVQHAGVVICQDRNPRHLYAGLPVTHPAVNKSRRFQVVTAAAVLIRRQIFEQIGGFDTAFHNGYEDVDLCLRLGERGYEVHYCHESVLYHYEGVSREGRSREEQYNLRLYRSRWAAGVRPDEFDYLVEDGLLRMSYQNLYPLSISISPLVASVNGAQPDQQQGQRILNMRSRQVFDLLRETIRLSTHVLEVELLGKAETRANLHTPKSADSDEPERVRELSCVLQKRASHHDPLVSPIADASRTEGEIQAALLDLHDQLLCRDEEILARICDLEKTLAAAIQQNATVAGEHFLSSKYLAYRQLIHRIRETVRCNLPPKGTVIVVSAGDDELLNLNGLQAWHFPQDRDGVYAGHYPASSADAIAQLEVLHSNGGEFFLFPITALWWFDYYADFRKHLDDNYRVLVTEEDACVIFALGDPGVGKTTEHEVR